MTVQARGAKTSDAVVEGIKTVVYALLIALVIRTFLFQPFNIPSGSMMDTLLKGDFLFVSKYAYGYSAHSFPWSLGPIAGRVWGGTPARGDVVVFKFPRDTSTDYIKRVVGLPGDRIQMRGGVLHINRVPVGMERIDDYVERLPDGRARAVARYVETLPEGNSHHVLDHGAGSWDETPEFEVPAGHVFVMGDNRDNSSDSRADVGYVPVENLVGRAEIIFFATDGETPFWQIWNWPWALRFERFFDTID